MQHQSQHHVPDGVTSLTVLQSAVTHLLWPAENAIVFGLIDGKVSHMFTLLHIQFAPMLLLVERPVEAGNEFWL